MKRERASETFWIGGGALEADKQEKRSEKVNGETTEREQRQGRSKTGQCGGKT